MLVRYLYNLLLHLALPLIALRLLFRALRAADYAKRVPERFALCLPKTQPGGIWLHAVSLGESIAAAPLVQALLERYPPVPRGFAPCLASACSIVICLMTCLGRRAVLSADCGQGLPF